MRTDLRTNLDHIMRRLIDASICGICTSSSSQAQFFVAESLKPLWTILRTLSMVCQPQSAVSSKSSSATCKAWAIVQLV